MESGAVLQREPLTEFIRVERARMDFDLHPSTSGDALRGVKDELDQMILAYAADRKGVLLSYKDVRIVGNKGHIHVYFPYIRVTADIKLELFVPKIGAKMRGVVSKVGNDYLSLLCGGVFHVAIGRQDIHEGFRPAGRGTWRGSSGEVIETGTEIVFELKEVVVAAGLFTMVGSMTGRGTGPADALGSDKGKEGRRGKKRGRDEEAEAELGKKARNQEKETPSKGKKAKEKEKEKETPGKEKRDKKEKEKEKEKKGGKKDKQGTKEQGKKESKAKK